MPDLGFAEVPERRLYRVDGGTLAVVVRGLDCTLLPPHGEITMYRPDGTVRAVTNWARGLRHGLSTHWHPNGQVHSVERYEESVRKEQKMYYDNGVLAMSYDGAELVTCWYPNGVKWMEYNMFSYLMQGMWNMQGVLGPADANDEWSSHEPMWAEPEVVEERA